MCIAWLRIQKVIAKFLLSELHKNANREMFILIEGEIEKCIQVVSLSCSPSFAVIYNSRN